MAAAKGATKRRETKSDKKEEAFVPFVCSFDNYLLVQLRQQNSPPCQSQTVVVLSAYVGGRMVASRLNVVDSLFYFS